MGYLKKLWHFIQQITVEPIGFLVFMSFMIMSTLSPSAEKRKMVREYRDTLPLDASELTVENMVQGQIVHWDMIFTAANLPLAMIMIIVWSALSDRVGRQTSILVGLAALQVLLFTSLVVYTDSVNAPLWVKPVINILSALGADYFIAYTSGQAFLADTIPNKELLTIRMNVVAIIRQIGLFIGTIIGGVMSRYGFSRGVLLGMILSAFTFIYALFRIPQVPPKMWAHRQRKLTLGDDEVVRKSSTQEGTEVQSKTAEKKGIQMIGYLFVDTWKTFFKKRTGHTRFFIISIALTQFVTSLSSMESSKLVGIYTLREPFEWGPHELSIFRSVGIVLGLIGSVGGIFLFKKILHLRDTTIIIIGLISQCLSTIPIAFASDMSLMQISNILGCLSGVAFPTLGSFGASLVPLHELGKIYTVFSMTSFVAVLISSFVLQQLYLVSLNFWPGFMWIFDAVIAGICVVVMIFVHFMSKKEHVGEQLPALNRDSQSETESNQIE